MSLNTITSPASTEGAYQFNALLYQFEDVWPYTAIANDGGNLQLTVGASAVADLAVGEFVWVEPLVGQDLISTPIVAILSKTATQITVDADYNGAYATSGDVRAMKALDFIIQSGLGSSNGQALRQRELSLRPDPNGIYNINPYQEVISRFYYNGPRTGVNTDHSTRYRVFAQSVGTGTYLRAFKSISGNSVPSVIHYSGVRNLLTYIPSGGTELLVGLETESTQELASAGNQEQEIDVFAFDCTTYEFTFSDPFDESFVTFTPEDWVSVQISGVAVTGVTFDFSGQTAGEYTWSIEYDDGATNKLYTFTIHVQNTIACRASCADARRFVWWSRDGGWCSYEFKRAIESEIEGGSAQLKQVDNVVSSVRYERQQEALTLLADVEGETIFDYLRGMLYALNVYEVITLNDATEDFDTYYLSRANGLPKRTQPFLATSNRFSVTLKKGMIEERINEGR